MSRNQIIGQVAFIGACIIFVFVLAIFFNGGGTVLDADWQHVTGPSD